MKPDLFRLIYTSEAARHVTTDDLREIRATATDRNARDDITGMLHFERGRFMQCLEGARTDVEALMAGIARDPRHRDIRIRCEDVVSQRMFADWSLGVTDDRVFSFHDFQVARMRKPLMTLAVCAELAAFLAALSQHAREALI